MPHLLLITCPDAPGLIHVITGVLLGQQLNILRNDEFVAREEGVFFMRTEFAAPATGFNGEALLAGGAPRAAAAGSRLQRRGAAGWPAGGAAAQATVVRLVLLATKEYHCLGELLLRHAFGDLNADLAAVVSNHAVLEPLVRQFGIPFHYLPHQGVAREAHEAQVLAAVGQYQPDWVVLAKYMRILSPEFVAHYPSRLINIYHSFLPAFVEASPYAQAYARGVKIIGATAHFVSNELDEEPIIAQNVLPIDHTQSARELAQAGRDVEKLTLARALKLVLDEQVVVHGNRTIIFG